MTNRLPAGTYFIGDPALVINPETWKLFLEEYEDSIENGEIIHINGSEMWVMFTDQGVYFDQNGTEYPVDSGALGIIPIDLIDDPSGEEQGLMMEFQKSVIVKNTAGAFYFGTICIETEINMDYDDRDDDTDDSFDDYHVW